MAQFFGTSQFWCNSHYRAVPWPKLLGGAWAVTEDKDELETDAVFDDVNRKEKTQFHGFHQANIKCTICDPSHQIGL
jgi:hypothetical protein